LLLAENVLAEACPERLPGSSPCARPYWARGPWALASRDRCSASRSPSAWLQLSRSSNVQVRRFFPDKPLGSPAPALGRPGCPREAERSCRWLGTLPVLDEVKTGLHRTGAFSAHGRFGLAPARAIVGSGPRAEPAGALFCCEELHRQVPRIGSRLPRGLCQRALFEAAAPDLPRGLPPTKDPSVRSSRDPDSGLRRGLFGGCGGSDPAAPPCVV
jgi:hypothetical protein